VRAASLHRALEQVRLAYGPDALVLQTRNVVSRAQHGLAPQTEVEVIVADPAAGEELGPYSVAGPLVAAPVDADAQDGPDGGASGELARQLARLERLAYRVEEMSAALSPAAELAQGYPLADRLRAAGAGEATVRHVAASFALAARGAAPTEALARRHLGTFLRTTRAASFAQIRGEHWLLGRAGVGKTTLALHLAAQLQRAGRKPAVVALAPRHDGDVRRIEAAAQALAIPAGAAFDATELESLREQLTGCDVVVVDTPCCISRTLPALPPSPAYRHLVVPRGEDPQQLRDLLEAIDGWTPDTLSVSMRDLSRRPGRLLDFVRELARPVAFFQGVFAGAVQLRLASAQDLLEEVLGADAAPAPRSLVAAGA
jgi:hypothetical protein